MRLRHIAPEKMTELYERAAHLMRLNLLTRRRTAVPLRRRPTPTSQRLWVYMRAGKPCLDCGTRIERFMQGDMGRTTYFWPRWEGVRGWVALAFPRRRGAVHAPSRGMREIVEMVAVVYSRHLRGR